MKTDINVMLVPGAAGLGSFWDPVAALLPAHWVKRTLDLPGLGAAPARADVTSYDQLIDYVARAIPTPSVVAGQSMGGYISLALALRYPELCTHLVLTVAAGGVDTARLGAKDWRPSARVSPTPGAPWACDPVPDLTAQLHRIKVPVALIWATRDPISPLSVARELEAHLPDARLLTFDTDDHWVARQFAEPTARAITELVQSPR